MNYYLELGIREFSDIDEIKESYKKLVKEYDKDILTRHKVIKLGMIYDTLTDPLKKMQYDNELIKDMIYDGEFKVLEDIYWKKMSEYKIKTKEHKRYKEILYKIKEIERLFNNKNRYQLTSKEIEEIESIMKIDEIDIKYTTVEDLKKEIDKDTKRYIDDNKDEDIKFDIPLSEDMYDKTKYTEYEEAYNDNNEQDKIYKEYKELKRTIKDGITPEEYEEYKKKREEQNEEIILYREKEAEILTGNITPDEFYDNK